MNESKLRAMLQEDMGEEADLFLPIAQSLNALQQPETQATAVLIDRLQPTPLSRWERLSDWYPLLILRSQIRVVQREIWWASAMVLLFGLLVTVLMKQPNSEQLLPLTIIAPLVTAAGVALLYDNEAENRLEIEAASPLGASLLMLARLTLIFAFDLSITFGCSLVLLVLHSELSFTPLILSWLLPMTFLSALAFFLSVYTRNALFGMTVSLGLWGVHIIFNHRAAQDNFITYVLSLPGLADPSTRPVLLVAAGLMVGVALWMISQAERRLAPAL